MEWHEISNVEYGNIFGKSDTIFHSAEFNELNKNKAENVHYLCLKRKNAFYGIIFGEKANSYFSPFSSPFGGMEFVGTFDANETINAAFLLSEFLKAKRLNVRITFPPILYNEDFINNAIIGLKSGGFQTTYVDVNFHLELNESTESGVNMERNAKKNLNKGLRTAHKFIKATSLIDQQRVYSVIKQNRDEKGYPLKLSFDDLKLTGELVPIDYYLLECDASDGAAAIVFKINSKTAMVVYWGHLQEFSDYRPINLLAFYLSKEYSSWSFSQLDIGPSSEFGILNEGLANFKDSIGCVRSEKITLSLKYE